MSAAVKQQTTVWISVLPHDVIHLFQVLFKVFDIFEMYAEGLKI